MISCCIMQSVGKSKRDTYLANLYHSLLAEKLNSNLNLSFIFAKSSVFI